MSGATRLFGAACTVAVLSVLAAGVFLTWRTYSPAPATPSVFTPAPATAAPEPEPAPETPAETVDIERPRQTAAPEPTRIVQPDLATPSPVAAATPAPKPVKVPAARAEPVAPPPAPTRQASNARPTWEGMVLAALNKAKRYPRDAYFARHQGVPYIRFAIDRKGRIVSVQLERSCGVRSLDQEALALPRRAQPLPAPPEEVPGETIELVVPVEFFLR